MIQFSLWHVNVKLVALRRAIFKKRVRLAFLYIRYALSPWEA
jgi:hypothetical protein